MQFSLLPLLFLINLPHILAHPTQENTKLPRQGPPASCGYMTTQANDAGEAMEMLKDNKCHIFSQYVPELVDKMQYFYLYDGCACLWWTVDSCPGFPPFFATGPVNQNFPDELAGHVRAYGCYTDQSTEVEGITNRTGNMLAAGSKSEVFDHMPFEV